MASVRDLGGGRWKVTIALGERTATGGYARTYRTITARNLTAARKRAQELEVELRQRQATLVAERATFAEAVEAWWETWTLRRRSPTTRDGYRALLDGHVLTGPLGAMRLRDVRPGHIDRWYLQLAQRLSPSTVRKVHTLVRQSLDHAVRNGWLAANPSVSAQLPEGRPQERQRASLEAVLAVLAAAHDRHPVRARALAFAARTGLRRGELAGLAWSRVDRVHLLLVVDTAAVRIRARGGPRVELKAPKHGQGAVIPIDAETRELVDAQMQWQLEECRRAELPISRAPFLWSTTPPFAAPLSPDTLSAWMAEARADAGVAGVRLHDLRHWAGSQLGDAVARVPGASRADVQRMLRHAQAATTDIYLHAEEDHAVRRRLLEHLPSLELPGGER